MSRWRLRNNSFSRCRLRSSINNSSSSRNSYCRRRCRLSSSFCRSEIKNIASLWRRRRRRRRRNQQPRTTKRTTTTATTSATTSSAASTDINPAYAKPQTNQVEGGTDRLLPHSQHKPFLTRGKKPFLANKGGRDAVFPRARALSFSFPPRSLSKERERVMGIERESRAGAVDRSSLPFFFRTRTFSFEDQISTPFVVLFFHAGRGAARVGGDRRRRRRK